MKTTYILKTTYVIWGPWEYLDRVANWATKLNQ